MQQIEADFFQLNDAAHAIGDEIAGIFSAPHPTG
jgi:hypothetical protein